MPVALKEGHVLDGAHVGISILKVTVFFNDIFIFFVRYIICRAGVVTVLQNGYSQKQLYVPLVGSAALSKDVKII